MLTKYLQESKQNLVALRDDDADAVEEVLCKIYGCFLPQANDKPWRFWFALVTVADKYLEPGLGDQSQHVAP